MIYLKKDKFFEIFITVAIVAFCASALIALGWYSWWMVTNPDIPDWFKYRIMFGRR